jgi:hypothetical protein
MTIETVNIVGVRSDGTEVSLGQGVMTPNLKIPEILNNYGFSERFDPDEFESAKAAMEDLIAWMIKQGWKAPDLLKVE